MGKELERFSVPDTISHKYLTTSSHVKGGFF